MEPFDFIDIRSFFEFRREPGMESNKFPINNTTQRESIKDLAEGLKDFLIVLEDDFLAEGETCGHLSALVVAS